MASKVKAAAGSVERLLLPRLNSIDGELKAINTRIDAVNTRIDAVQKSVGDLDKRLTSWIDSLRNELRAEIRAVDSKVDQLDKKLDIDRRMLIMEAKMKELEKRS